MKNWRPDVLLSRKGWYPAWSHSRQKKNIVSCNMCVQSFVVGWVALYRLGHVRPRPFDCWHSAQTTPFKFQGVQCRLPCEQSGPDVQTRKFMQTGCSTMRQEFTHGGFLKSEASCVRAFEASPCCLQLPWDLIVVANPPASFNIVTVHSGVDEAWQGGQDLVCVGTRNWPACRDSFRRCWAHWQESDVMGLLMQSVLSSTNSTAAVWIAAATGKGNMD